MLHAHWDETWVHVIASGFLLSLGKKQTRTGRETWVNLNTPLRTFSLLKSSVKVKRMPEKNSMNLSFNHFYLLAYKLKISGGKVGYECRWIREANATLKTKSELQTFADFHCVSPHKTEVFTCRNTHTFISSSAVFLELLCACKSEQKNIHF